MAGLLDIVYPAGLRAWQTLPRRCSSMVSLGIEKVVTPSRHILAWCFGIKLMFCSLVRIGSASLLGL